MKRSIIILLVVLLLSSLMVLSPLRLVASSPYTDDAYYWPAVDTMATTTPVYDRNAREFIFLEDTTQYSDTVVMRIVEK